MNSNEFAAYIITATFNLGMLATLTFYEVPMWITATLILVNSVTMVTTFNTLLRRRPIKVKAS